uniref:Centrosomal protein of 83 kDa-like n=1 Tax=Saccoglossus kowalevskii TaxID=10224 RepID=A0ABM0GM71_SACKO|nr:PREDICTED: centrosomal protein of 83 kDa-like [Saccoglossus kowalevskii]
MMASSGPLSASFPMQGTLPKLAQETELQKMLTDERMRCEMHKTNYQTLKAEHQRLQDELQRVQSNLDRQTEESRMMEERCQTLVSRARKELSEKTAEVEEFKTQVVTPQKMELMRLKIADELEHPYRERLGRMDSEVEKYRSDFNKLRYEYSFLKQEYEHEKAEAKRMMDEMKIQYETEDAQRNRVLQRENAQLHLKIKGLLTELEEIRAQREQAGLQSDHIARMQSKQLSENAAMVKTLEAEKESLKLHVDQLQQELSTALDMQKTLNTRAHDLERDKTSLKSQLEEITHRGKIDMTNMKMDLVKSKGELERQRDTLAHELEGYRTKVEVLQYSLDTQTTTLAEKEKEMVRKVQSVREEEWEKINKLENEKLELEAKLQEIERRKVEEESRKADEKERIEDRIKDAETRREESEKECLVLRTKLEQRSSLNDQLHHETQQNTDLREKLHQIRTELQSLQGVEQELSSENEKLNNKVELLGNELNMAVAEIEKAEEANHRQLDQQRVGFIDEKQQLQKRIDEMEQHISEIHGRMDRMTSTHKKKKKQYIKIVKRVKEKLQISNAKLEELEIQKQALKKNVPQETYVKLKRQLRDMYQRHQEYRHLILNGAVGEFSFTQAAMPLGQSTGPWSSLIEPENQHQQDLAALRERLDNLDGNQRLQLDELIGNMEPSKLYDNDKENASSVDGKHTDNENL